MSIYSSLSSLLSSSPSSVFPFSVSLPSPSSPPASPQEKELARKTRQRSLDAKRCFHLFQFAANCFFHLLLPVPTYFHLFPPYVCFFHLFLPAPTCFHLLSPSARCFHLLCPASRWNFCRSGKSWRTPEGGNLKREKYPSMY